MTLAQARRRVTYCRGALVRLDQEVAPSTTRKERRATLEVALAQAEAWLAGHCARCGATLTDPTSIARGVGPECAAKAVA